jgi:cobalt-zinc-cadmium efflux system protein
VTLAIVLVIVVGTWSLFRQSLHLLFDGVPDGIDVRAVERYLCSLPGVESVHDLHVWAISTSNTALTAHLVMPSGYPGSTFFVTTAKALHDQFEILHPTLQVETELLDDDCGTARPTHDTPADNHA